MRAVVTLPYYLASVCQIMRCTACNVGVLAPGAVGVLAQCCFDVASYPANARSILAGAQDKIAVQSALGGYILKRMRWIRRLIALSQLAGGALLIALEFGARGRGAALPVWHVALVVLLGGASAVAGLLLWRGSALGRMASLTIQALQVVQFDLAVGSYAFVAGLKFAVFATGAFLVGTNFGFLGTLVLGPNGSVAAGQAPSQVAVNLAALAAAVFLLIEGQPAGSHTSPSRPPA